MYAYITYHHRFLFAVYKTQAVLEYQEVYRVFVLATSNLEIKKLKPSSVIVSKSLRLLEATDEFSVLDFFTYKYTPLFLSLFVSVNYNPENQFLGVTVSKRIDTNPPITTHIIFAIVRSTN